jgi:hypothetical protein
VKRAASFKVASVRTLFKCTNCAGPQRNVSLCVSRQCTRRPRVCPPAMANAIVSAPDGFYAEGVTFQSPASRSARWVTCHQSSIEPQRGSTRFVFGCVHDVKPHWGLGWYGFRFPGCAGGPATPGFGIEPLRGWCRYSYFLRIWPYAEGVTFHSPASRSARWEIVDHHTIRSPTGFHIV